MHMLIVRNNSNPKAQDASMLLASYLTTQNIEYTMVNSSELLHVQHHKGIQAALAHGVQMAVVLGGDGSILHTARQVACADVPILGINFGRLGFLANPSDDGVVAIVVAALTGDVVAEKRTNLCIRVVCEGEADLWSDAEAADDTLLAAQEVCEGEADLWSDTEAADDTLLAAQEAPHSFFALNELVVTHGLRDRVVDFSFGISDSPIADMRGDGLVVATATGSSAYALSAGGPLVSPEFGGLVVVPLAPHTLHSRAIVTAPGDVVEIELPPHTARQDVALLADGELLNFDSPVRRIYVSCGTNPTVLLRYRQEGFYAHAAKVFF